MKDLFSILAVPVTIIFTVFFTVAIIYSVVMYMPSENTYWFEESHIACKHTKKMGLDSKTEKACYILEAIKQK